MPKMIFGSLFEKCKTLYTNIKTTNFRVGSLTFLRVVVVISLIPVVVVVGIWVRAYVTGDMNPWIITMIDTGLRIIDHVWQAQVVAGVAAYGAAWTDSNNDGNSDMWTQQSERKNS